jgi:hypothetical protein
VAMPLLALLLAGTLCNNAAMIARWRGWGWQ